jgi:hypothetical protein
VPSYNWSNLGDYDFELVCQSVLSQRLGVPVEAFARGRDGGIDLRCTLDGRLILGQAKHFAASGYSRLLSKMREEAARVTDMRPRPYRYILFTTVGLNAARKRELKDACKPFIRRASDIWGVEDIEAVIRMNPRIEEAHYKLWLSSSAVIERIVNSPTYGRSQVKIAEILSKASFYVPHEKMTDAQSILRNERSLIISGPAGVGKTTMAEMLALRVINMDYSVYFVTEVGELEAKLALPEKQLLIFDDFLGRTNLREAPAYSDQERLMTALRTVASSTNRYLILTTREYIYREAMATSERLAASRAGFMRCLIDVSGYSKIARAQILHNHLRWTRGVDPSAIRELVEAGKHFSIVDHANFNPRWIADALHRAAVPVTSDEDDSPWT